MSHTSALPLELADSGFVHKASLFFRAQHLGFSLRFWTACIDGTSLWAAVWAGQPW